MSCEEKGACPDGTARGEEEGTTCRSRKGGGQEKVPLLVSLKRERGEKKKTMEPVCGCRRLKLPPSGPH